MKRYNSWQEVLVQQAYHEGWLNGWNTSDMTQGRSFAAEEHKAELALLKMLKPCEMCEGSGIDDSVEYFPHCSTCSGTGIAP